jgi:hypothetical protein
MPMWIGSVWRGIYRFFAAWHRQTQAHPYFAAFSAFFVLPCVLIGGAIIYFDLVEAYDEFKFNHLSPAEHLRLAHDACRIEQYGGTTCADPSTATSNLNKIPRDASGYGEAHKLAEVIRLQQEAAAERRRQDLAKQEAERLRLANQTQQESFDQMERNVTGSAHDPYRCATATGGWQIFSFDNGHYWWRDDGRCAREELREEAAAEQRQIEQRAARERQQKQRDEDAQLLSYWPTTLRVDTDMDSFWLNNEERTCTTSPDAKGRVARVNCSANASHQDHSIPVKFWGGVDRNTVSDWKCRREGDEFVCRAID